MQIRKAILKDVEAIKQIADLLYIEMPDFVWNQEDFIKKQIERGEYYVLEKDKVLGILSLREKQGMMYIETLAVAKDLQAKGIGSKLIEFAKDFGRKNNFKILRTTSFYEYGVKDFYIKNGFRLLPESGKYSGHKFHRLEIDV